ncbi:MAG: DUF3857 domain-containing protein, partial [Chitinophagaceae bacterium]
NIFSEYEVHVRMKILSEKGFSHADVMIPYTSYKNEESVRGLVAQTYNFDASGNATITKVEKNVIYDKKIDTRISRQVFTFPEVKAGSILEYKYSIRGAWLQDWYFQENIPVMLSRYSLEFPVDLEIYSEQFGQYKVETKTSLKGNSNIHVHTARQLPGFRDEPFITVDDDYLQRLHSTITAFTVDGIRKNYLPNWPQVINALMEDEDFGIQLNKNIPRTADLDATLKTLKAPYDKMRAIHAYVRKNMEWNGLASIWALDGVKSAWKDKKGTSGEINLILINLLQDAGLNAHPLLVSTRANGRVSTNMPDWRKFNKVLAHVKIDDHVYVLDGTEKFTSSRLVPIDVMYSEALVIGKTKGDTWGWEVIWDPAQTFNHMTTFKAVLNESGVINGEATVTSTDYSRVERMPILKQGKEKFVSHYFQANNPNINIENVDIENEDNDSLPLVQKVKFSHPVNESGNYRYFSVNIFSGLEKNPFMKEERFSDVFFGANQRYNILGEIELPKGYAFDELPKNVRMIMPDTSITISRMTSTKGNKAWLRISLDFKKPIYAPDEYPYFMEFYKKLFAILNEQYVIRKEDGVAANN